MAEDVEGLGQSTCLGAAWKDYKLQIWGKVVQGADCSFEHPTVELDL